MKPLIFAILAAITASALADMPVVFPDNQKFAEFGRNFLVESTIPGNFKTPEGVVAAMLMLGDQVRDEKLSAPFSPSTLKGSSQFEGAHQLGSYLRGARMDGATFVICFSSEAMRYLNNTAAIQQVVKGAIEATIKKNFPVIESIVYEVDGNIVTDWDA